MPMPSSSVQIAPLHYPHLSHSEIFVSVEEFYRRFYFRSGKISSIVGEMIRSPQMMKRRLHEGVEFFYFLRERGARIERVARRSARHREGGNPATGLPFLRE